MKTLFLILSTALLAAPSGPEVVHGQVDIQSLPGSTAVNSGERAIVNWQDFSIDVDEQVQFFQEGPQSVIINRVIGDNPSELLGQLTSNGHVLLLNPQGVLIGDDAIIDTGAFYASAFDSFVQVGGAICGSSVQIYDGTVIRGGEVFDSSSTKNSLPNTYSVWDQLNLAFKGLDRPAVLE